MTRDDLAAEVRKLRAAIREHRDSAGHRLCWYQPELWRLVPDNTGIDTHRPESVPAWPQFLEGCVKYRESLDRQAPSAPRTDEPYEPRRESQ